MLENIIAFSLRNKLFVLLLVFGLIGYGIYAVTELSVGAVPDVTNNQVQVITTSQNLSTQDIEQYITYPIEMEMANLPGVKEIRSISKFGISLVTIVFDDDMGNYLPRQLIAEKIKSASEKIPNGFGVPQMGPITTGLGEIYQYTLEVSPEYKDQYDVEALRTIQDWIVRRQLSGIRGVVEINTWGGLLKQYEVALKPAQLKAMNITASEVFEAIAQNNSIAGGAYIEKVNQSYFIRGEGKIKSLTDMEQVVVKNDGIPIYVRDVAQVKIGYANRFGAITGNGEGEKVMGQIMMLKGANSKAVIADIDKRIELVNKGLPPGIRINGFLQRSELVHKTTFTVAENLILGCLIVIFVVVMLLGNIRSGLVVASVIPLCLLFAITLMTIFGIDANLMSLGAIDFGIIIDGAVIIVEFIAFQVFQQSKHLTGLEPAQQQLEIDQITFKSASRMMHSAVFGQLIILIVFIPILSLTGVEGKMFKPMAITFSFAIVGAMILCFTYVPVIASLVLKPSKKEGFAFSKQFITWIQKMYVPVLERALHHPKWVLSGAIGLLLGALLLFGSMGGEFVPTLDEGDFVIQPILKTGTTLSKTIATTTQIEQIILKNFPEVEQVVSRIGAAEVPTDPMSMEESDIIVKLKPKSEWTTTDSKDALADLIKEKVEQKIPNLEIEFTQPIEMRFNELISGTRSDLAIKVFGEDLDILAKKAHEIGNLIKNIPGAADVIIEKTAGLPQMSVTYNRAKIARYGLTIASLNDLLTMTFAGKTAGTVFEGEKRFDLVIRLDAAYRESIVDVENLYVPLANGSQIPLSELATIKYDQGPAKISRDNTHRRIVVGVNVRNRDLQSVVEEVQQKLKSKLKLPTGYFVTYGGQFENLQSAKSRLMIAVPIALILIFILLYFAFQSVREALMVYSAIPLSAVGGIGLLWLRDLPFSISAGVGFIALFGIAVLNGIVLIEHFKELKLNHPTNLKDLILKGTSDRLRPVLLTAAAAALGFLPMAISESAGAEVQRPLATVVIGGLVTATLLTLIVLPVLYFVFDKKKVTKPQFKIHVGFWLFPFLGFSTMAQAQWNPPAPLQQLMEMAHSNNKGLKGKQQQVDRMKAQIGVAYQMEKTNVYYSYDQNNLALNNLPLKVFGVQQRFMLPMYYKAFKNLLNQDFEREQRLLNWQQSRIDVEIAKLYYKLIAINARSKVVQELDSLFVLFAKAGSRKFELGEANYLEKITAEAKSQKIRTLKNQWMQEREVAMQELKFWVQAENVPIVPSDKWEVLLLPQESAHESVYVTQLKQTEIYLDRQNAYHRSMYWPELNIDYFQGTNSGLSGPLYGFQVGLAVPLFGRGNHARLQASQIEKMAWVSQQQQAMVKLEQFKKTQQAKLKKAQEMIQYFDLHGRKLATEITKVAQRSYQSGEIDFYQYIQSLEQAFTLQLDYWDALYEHTAIQLDLYYLNWN
ncbi:MAG: CusA/CzcA family heavy metal efflux RND transporter [Flavobacterium sp. BFFFF2]|nr:MAG: CusA/CzcA family heavy metal efflux RND transporter [Flavobacterium sp. BFFFF2]